MTNNASRADDYSTRRKLFETSKENFLDIKGDISADMKNEVYAVRPLGQSFIE